MYTDELVEGRWIAWIDDVVRFAVEEVGRADIGKDADDGEFALSTRKLFQLSICRPVEILSLWLSKDGALTFPETNDEEDVAVFEMRCG